MNGSATARYEQFFQTEHLTKDLHGRSFRGGVVTLSGQVIKFLLGLISTAILARLLRPQDFGLVAMVTSITAFVGLFKDLGLSNATVQRLQVTHVQISFLFWINVVLSLGTTLVVICLAPLIAWFYHEPRLVWVSIVLSISFIFSGLSVQHQALLRRQMQFKTLAVRDVVALAFGTAVSIGLALAGFGYWSLVAAPVAINIASCILLWTICDWRPGGFQRGVGARSMLVFGGNLTAFNLINYFTRNFDNILIGRVLGAGPLGIYSKAYGLLTLPASQINAPMAAVLLPGLSRLQNDPVEYGKLFVNAVRSIALLTVPTVVFSFFFARDIVLVLLGRRWLPVAPVFQCLAPAALFGAIAFVPGWLCQSLGRSRRQLNYALVSAPICVAGFIIGIRWGIVGVAASYSITYSCLFCWYVWYSSRNSPVTFAEVCAAFLAATFPALLAGAIAWLLRLSLYNNVLPVTSLVFSGLIFVAIYLGFAALTARNRTLIAAGIASVRKAIRV
jgi:O-antigen/teichoic acid export membrane protein